MRIGLDARMLGKLGIGTYVAGLLRAVPRVLSDDDRLIVFTSPDGRNQALSLIAEAHNVELRTTPGSFRQVRDQIELGWRFRAAGLDVLHVPHYNEPFTCFESTVVTIHDLIPLLYPGLFSVARRGLVRLQLGRTIRRARALIVPSNHTSVDLQQLLGVAETRITVIPEAAEGLSQSHVDSEAAKEWMDRYELQPPYLFYSGQWTRYKNVHVLLDAFSDLLACHPALRLVIGGPRDAAEPSLKKQIRTLADHVRVVGWIPDQLMAWVVRQAAVSVFPSEYEGFGLPVLEAMALGVPVVCARASSLPEVAGDAAEYWEPNTGPAGLAAAIDRALDPRRAEELRSVGRVQAARFSWDITARRTMAVYYQAASPRVSRY